MQKLNFEEFNKRVSEVNKAARIFAPLTNNISEAFEIYQKVLAEEEMAVFISTAVGNRPVTLMDSFIRPKCPECDTDLMLRIDVEDINKKKWNTSWTCTKCITDYYSDKTVKDWMDELRRSDV